MNKLKQSRLFIIVFILLPVFWTFAERGQNVTVNPADLVRTVRSQENWLHKFETLYIYAEMQWMKTRAEIQKRKVNIGPELPVENLDPNQFDELLPSHKEHVEFAIDKTRIRFFKNDLTHYLSLRIWDGEEFRGWEKYYNHPQNTYILNDTLESHSYFKELLSCKFGWPRSQPHSFWWYECDVESLMKLYGKAEDFTLGPTETFRGRQCYQLNYSASEFHGLIFRWFVGVDDHLLYGIQTLRNGRKTVEHWVDDYHPVTFSGQFPMRLGWTFYEQNNKGQDYPETECRVTVLDFRLNEPLDDELFTLEFQEGITIQDVRGGQVREYILTEKKDHKMAPKTAVEECRSIFANPNAKIYKMKHQKGGDDKFSGQPIEKTSMRVHEIELRRVPLPNIEQIQQPRVRYGNLQFQDAGKSLFRCALLGNQGDRYNQVFYIDLNQNGRWDENERLKGREPTRKTGSPKTSFGYFDVPLVDENSCRYMHRVFAVYNHFDQLFVVSHCWKEGQIKLGDEMITVYLIDYNCDGRYDSGRPIMEQMLFMEPYEACYDYVGWDKNKNGQLDYDEYFYIGSFSVYKGQVYQIAASQEGSQIAVLPVKVPVGLLQLPVEDCYVYLWGRKGPTTLLGGIKPITVPAGTYWAQYTGYTLHSPDGGESQQVKMGRYYHKPWIIREGQTTSIPQSLLEISDEDEKLYEAKLEALRQEQKSARTQFVDDDYNTVLGETVINLSDFGLDNTFKPKHGSRLLLCFWNYNQRPSRHAVSELVALKETIEKQDIEVILIHSTPISENIKEWIDQKNVSFQLGSLAEKSDTVRAKWGVKSLPWLILTDKEHVVTAEGFRLNELNDMLEKL